MIYIKMHLTISITKLNLKCGFLIINFIVQLGKQEHFMVNWISVCLQGINRGAGVLATAFMASIKLLVFLAWISYGLCALVYAGMC